jgi:hypothetical protein
MFSSSSVNADRHGWTSLDHYFHVHESHMQRFMASGFVLSHDLDTSPIPNGLILSGRIRCQNGLFTDVRKVLVVEDRHGRPWVRTERYSYQAGLEDGENRPIFRYDNAHPYRGHADDYHRHRFDPTTWEEIDPPEWIGRENWPHLSDVIDELHGWWDAIGQFLD